MSKIWIVPALALLMLAASCGNKSEKTETADVGTTGTLEFYGDTISTEGAIAIDALLATMGDEDVKEVKIKGKVGEVCQMKGCWMTMDLGNGEEMIVRFKDYGFFVPKDCTGRDAVLEGVVERTVTSVDDLRHYAEDAGKSEEEIMAITEPKAGLEFTASGVVLL